MQIITNTENLDALCKRLSQHPYITIDTEFLRENTFWPQLCLVQLASDDESAIVDPLSKGIDLAPLFDLLQNEDVIKVFHAGRQDLEIFHRLTGKVPTPIFDTQVAAMVCGFGESVGYDTLVTKLAGAQIDKSSRFTDWSRRPLTDRQLSYAEADVTFLRDAYKSLKATLEETGRANWLVSEMKILQSEETYFTPPEHAWKRIKTRNNKPRFLAILQAVAAWRETQAHKQDMPRNRILRDEALLDIASNPPKNAEKLSHVRGIGNKFAEGHMGASLLAAIEQGRSIPDDQCPVVAKKEPLPKGLGPLMDLLRVMLKMRCEENDVAQKLVCSTGDLEKIAAGSDADVPALKGWRYEVFGKDALDLKAGKIAFTIKGKNIHVIKL
ncbi:ribonuclease D [Sneathiella sp. P13V-1]|uniref:ribonuclease D n=1 Tax=Sneathiella sp. P13V-1 TaxID=2697366 RepID=UPI00187B9577|nr:ribonuclease D [Sneathiella sp. P13V-1]MBE7637156.1 ribonuclease D [Sneathiella sp. P13V-1]